MKKTIALILIAALALALAACAPKKTPTADFNIAALKGPTAMGLVSLMDRSGLGEYKNTYAVTVYGTADEIVPRLTKGEIDVACIPANLAATLYNKTDGAIELCAVNTLGVLYVVQTGDAVSSVADLKGKTVYSTGKGTTPEYALNYILTQNGIDPQKDLTIEFKSESSEIAALLASGTKDMIAVLPQPYVTTVTMKNESVTIALNLTEEWDKAADGDSRLVTGTVVARKEFIEANPEAFAAFLDDCAASVDFTLGHTDEAAALCERFGIVAAAVAKQALPYCNITFLTGDEMKSAVSGYLKTLYDSNPDSVGGYEIDDKFYYIP